VASIYNKFIKELGKFMFMSCALSALPLLATRLGAGIGTFVSTVFLSVLGLLVWGGFFKNAPKWNALGVVPALSISTALLNYHWKSPVADFPWAIGLLTVWIVSGALFTYLALARASK
jgi:hypothetical protein